MNEKTENRVSSGAAKTVLVFHEGDGAKAVVTQIVARRRKTAAKTRIRFQGPADFTKNAADHIRKIVWPVADAVLSRLTDQSYGFDLSVSNLAAASSKEVAVDISGFSADVSVFISILSAGTGIPVRDTLVFTGHIAGTDGSIRMVSGIPEKAAAVTTAPNTDTLVYPDLGGDLSMKELSPQETERIEGALSQAKDRIRLTAVRDVGDLVRLAFSERDILAASLKEGFFQLQEHQFESGGAVYRAAHHLTAGLDRRFWKQLYADLSQGRSRKALSLLADFTEYFIRKETYLPQTGQELFRVIASLPPDTRRLKLRFPLLSILKCAELCRFAGESQSRDAWLFLKACSGEIGPSLVSHSPTGPDLSPVDSEKDRLLDTLISEIEEDRIALEITVKIDNARASYVMESVESHSHEHFCEVIASYFIHLSRHLHGFTGPADMDAAGAEGLETLEKAFAGKGGFPAALAEARHATNGGMRYVLDVFTEQYKRDQTEKHINRIFKLAMDPLDWDRKVRLMESVIDRLQNMLPGEIADQPAERFAVHYEPIVRALIQSRDRLTSVFRTF